MGRDVTGADCEYLTGMSPLRPLGCPINTSADHCDWPHKSWGLLFSWKLVFTIDYTYICLFLSRCRFYNSILEIFMPALLLFSSNVYPQSRYYKVLTTPGGVLNLENFQQSAEDRTTNCFNLQLHIFVFGVFRCSLGILSPFHWERGAGVGDIFHRTSHTAQHRWS